jgi:hypothetical protein
MTNQSSEVDRTSVVVVALDVVSYSLELDQVQERMVRLLSDVISECGMATGSAPTILPTGDGALVVLEREPASAALSLALRFRQAIEERLLPLSLRIGNSRVTSTRICWAGDSGLTSASSVSASDTYSSLAIPPAATSEKSECSRQTTRAR